jgi:hypothetical protein
LASSWRKRSRAATVEHHRLIVGLLVLIWGASGLAQAGLFTMAQVWNLPARRDRDMFSAWTGP